MTQQDVGSLAVVRSALARNQVFVSHSLVDPSGRPVRGMASIAPDLPPWPRVRTMSGALLDPSPVEVALDALGTYRLRLEASAVSVPPGIFSVLSYAGLQYRFIVEDDDQDNRPAPLPVAFGTVGGTVVDPAGLAVPGLVVALSPYPEQEREMLVLLDRRLMVPLPLRAETDVNGAFSFSIFTQSSYVERSPRFRVSTAFNIDYVTDSPLS